MTQEIKAYLVELENLKKKKKLNEGEISEILVRIGFYQHERLVHLIVMVMIAILTIMVFVAMMVSQNVNWGLNFLFLFLLILLVPYIFHYYFLENSVQKMYKLYYDCIKK